MKIQFKMLNGLCVPTSTPDNYQEREAKAWLERHRTIAQVGRRVATAITERNQRGRTCDSAETVAYANNSGRIYQEVSKEIKGDENGNSSPFERARSRVSNPTEPTNIGWWTNEPAVGRMVHGVADRLDRIKSIGDGQVPAVVKLAWESLT